MKKQIVSKGSQALKRAKGESLDENQFFRQASLKIFSSLDIETSMKSFVEFVGRHIPISGMSFGLYDPELNVGKMLASVWPSDLAKPSKIVALPMKLRAYIKKSWDDSSGVRIINDMDSEDYPDKQIFSSVWPEDVSLLLMELAIDSRRLGSLQIFAKGKNRYTSHHAHLVSLLHEPLATYIAIILGHQEIKRLNDMLIEHNRYLYSEMRKMTDPTIIGANFGLRQVMQLVSQVAPMDTPVLLMGETGVGKEVIANAIHASSQQHKNPFIKVNCGAIPESLIDSELFGHEKGAFTGASARKPGHFERAHTGTIFLDEVGELPPAAQVRLLRVLQHHEIERVGGTEPIPIKVRVISATNRNLEEMVQSGRFRRDLWFRINLFPIFIPPLRQRTEDIPALVAHFLERKGKKLKVRNQPPLAPGDLEHLQTYSWPGNVRELENLVERALILSQSVEENDVIRFKRLLPDPLAREKDQGQSLPGLPGSIVPLDEMVTRHIQAALRQASGKIEGPGGAAHLLGINPSTLRGKMRKMKIPFGRNCGLQSLRP